MNKSKNKKETISKDNFIEFLANSTPEDVNNLIKEKGKPPRMICPIFFYPK